MKDMFYSITGHDAGSDTYDFLRTASTLQEAEAMAMRLAGGTGPYAGRYDRITVADSEARIVRTYDRRKDIGKQNI